jgi:hypothetical protein
MVPAPDSLPRDVSGGGQVDDDAVDGALGDPDPFTDLTQPYAWVGGDADQHLSVVGKESPAGRGVIRHDTRLAILDINFML